MLGLTSQHDLQVLVVVVVEADLDRDLSHRDSSVMTPEK
jgi:hypothetical protein